METTYFGTATAWGSGGGPGPWIMSDMEAGLFSGYNAKQNAADPTIDACASLRSSMPTELVLVGGILVVAAGGLFFLILHRHKTAEPPHFRYAEV